jgi:hypothetical protein
MIPRALHSLFWDIQLAQFDPKTYPDYTILRVLELGNREAVTWLQHTFDQGEICRVLRSEKRLSRRSANFWALIYCVPAEEIAALQIDRKSPGLF